jgi:hypothetical protein
MYAFTDWWQTGLGAAEYWYKTITDSGEKPVIALVGSVQYVSSLVVVDNIYNSEALFHIFN